MAKRMPSSQIGSFVNIMKHWYDLTCPFCYLSQPVNETLRKVGDVIELPFQAHPEVPITGKYMGPRHGLMYDNIAAQARAAGLKLKWRDVLPNSRMALAAAEWARVTKPDASDAFRTSLFRAHFADDLDIGDRNVVLDLATRAGLEAEMLNEALDNGSAFELVDESESQARKNGINGTPAWEVAGHIVSGLQDASKLLTLVDAEQQKQ